VGNNNSCSGISNGNNGDQVGTAAAPLDPMLGGLANNGGPTQTMALLSGSPAIGKGDTNTCQNVPINDKDQRGLARNSAARSACDVGAYDTGGVTQLTVQIQTLAGWNLIGGSPLTVFADATVSWSWSAATGTWTHPTGTEPAGTGAWENVPTAGPRNVSIQSCTVGTPISLPVVPHRWNLIGNPCGKAVQLPSDARALLWTGTYTLSQTIAAGTAAWVLPNTTPLNLTPM
jgi:hypothetical protein